ncbi:uncharacterized protein LOC119263270 [Pygocentrus nattereri]|uniref:uncharacterized protein LOC119263270 n=1 Tax=Pygocentrus nattereri TaxID=42514 RepID=UPI001891D1DA|nr:uncharacterized protein LOC119263270 [Pygocentrus nattereri]
MITSLDRDTPHSSRVDLTQEDSVVASCSGATCAFADACGSEEEVDCEIGSSSSDSGIEDLSHSDLRSSLSDWAVEFGVSLVALSALLSILRVHHPFLPKDGRSLLKTRTEYVVEKKDSSTRNMYHIVSFVETEEVEIVPAVWVKDSVCLWTPYKSEGVQRATKSQEQPHENWTPYNIKVLYTTNNYVEARRKLPLAEQQTDLQSEAENESLKPPKRKIKPNKHLLEDGYDTDEEAFVPKKKVLPQAPRIKSTAVPCNFYINFSNIIVVSSLT